MKIIKNTHLSIIFGLSLAILILTAGVAYLCLGDVVTPLIVHFDVYKGIDFFGDRVDILGIFIVVSVMFLINLILAEFIFDRQRFLSFVMAYVDLILSFLILIVISVIISIN